MSNQNKQTKIVEKKKDKSFIFIAVVVAYFYLFKNKTHRTEIGKSFFFDVVIVKEKYDYI